MAGNENVSINIDSKADLRGFKQAESAASKLNKTVKGLAATLGVAYGTRAVVNFGKASIKAFTEDQKSAIKLSQAVKNLGLSFEQTNIDGFISNLEKTAGIADDVLRPAFQALLTTTGDVAKSQDLLKTAINVSRGSGEDLNTVVDDLSKSYVGITKGLEKYKLGLSRAQLKEMSFLDVQERLNKQFKGASAAYLASYSGKMELLTTAAGNAQEVIGGALINAIINLSGAGDVQGVVNKIDAIAASSEKAITRVGELGQALYFSFSKLSYAEFLGFSTAGVDRFQKIIEEQRRKAQYAGASPFDAGNNSVTGYKKDQKAAADAKKAADLQAKLLKQSLDNQKKLTAEQKKQAALKKAGTVFDMEQIQLIAALKNQLSSEERLRVEAMLAILNENDVLAQQLTKQILMAQDATGGLYKYFLSIGDTKIKNPFAFLDQWIIDFQKKLNDLFNPSGGAKKNPDTYVPAAFDPALAAIGVIPGYGDYSGSVANQYSNEVLNGLYGMQTGGADIPDMADIPATNVPEGSGSWNGWSSGISNLGSAPVINNYFGGSVVTDQKLIDMVMSGTQIASLSGQPSQIGRIAGMFG